MRQLCLGACGFDGTLRAACRYCLRNYLRSGEVRRLHAPFIHSFASEFWEQVKPGNRTEILKLRFPIVIALLISRCSDGRTCRVEKLPGREGLSSWLVRSPVSGAREKHQRRIHPAIRCRWCAVAWRLPRTKKSRTPRKQELDLNSANADKRNESSPKDKYIEKIQFLGAFDRFRFFFCS
ncbi:hypothetical protein B0I37DRAFT_208587 [Chaetomium sp. MPI-CAGE-AT-0009]|nr:hypothetical protein B0I37DRAFT_208587 [Chaetomium sp. MPI-CAGE-AT-0009]